MLCPYLVTYHEGEWKEVASCLYYHSSHSEAGCSAMLSVYAMCDLIQMSHPTGTECMKEKRSRDRKCRERRLKYCISEVQLTSAICYSSPNSLKEIIEPIPRKAHSEECGNVPRDLIHHEIDKSVRQRWVIKIVRETDNISTRGRTKRFPVCLSFLHDNFRLQRFTG